MSKKILITVSYYTPHVSGLTNAVKNLAEFLAENGEKVSILTTQHLKSLPLDEKINGVDVHRSPFLFRITKGFFMPLYIFDVIKNINKSDNIIINLPQFEGFIVAIIAKLFNKKLMCLYHCDVNFKKGFFNSIIHHTLSIANNISLFLSDKIFNLTEDYALNSRALQPYKEKWMLLPPIIPLPVIHTDNVKRLSSMLPKKKYLIGFLGRISSEKGVEYLLDTIPILKNKLNNDFCIVFAGPNVVVGEDDYRKHIDKLLLKYSRYVRRIGELPPNYLGAYYSLLNTLVISSIDSTEAFGIVQVEALYCGTPAVVTDLPGVRVPIKTTGMGEIAHIKDSPDLAEKIIKVLLYKSYIKNQSLLREAFRFNKNLPAYKEIIS